jgi:hypothetical protein
VQVVAQLRGARPLPCEEQRLNERQSQQLGSLKELVLAMLHRDARQRISMQQFTAALLQRRS